VSLRDAAFDEPGVSRKRERERNEKRETKINFLPSAIFRANFFEVSHPSRQTRAKIIRVHSKHHSIRVVPPPRFISNTLRKRNEELRIIGYGAPD